VCAVLAHTSVSALDVGERPTARRASNDVAESTLVEARVVPAVGLDVLEKRKIIFYEI